MNGSIRTIVAGIAEIHQPDPYLAPAVELARALGAQLHVVHSFQLPDPILYPYPDVTLMSPEAIQQFHDTVQGLLEARVREVAGGDDIRCHSVPGPADRAVVEVAEETGADLVLIGATRHGTLAQTILGSTAQRILRSATTPVLMTRLAHFAPPGRVLLATDLSELSERVYRRGLELIGALGAGDDAEIRALLVLAYDVELPAPLSRDALDETARTQLDNFLQRVEPGAPASRGKIRTGDPAKEIVAEAAEWRADLLVLGTHGRGGVSRFLIGSVAEGALRGALGDVLVIPAAAIQPPVPGAD